MTTVFQVIDTPKRELEWKLLLSKKLASRGINSYISYFPNVREKFLQENGGIIFGRLGGASGRTKVDLEFINEIKKYQGKIFFHHDEGGLYESKDYERETKLLYPYEILDNQIFEKVYFWGDAQKYFFKN